MKALLFCLALALSGCASTVSQPSDLDLLLVPDAVAAQLTPPPLDYVRLERALLAHVNAVRASHSRAPLTEVSRLTDAARAHSEQMSTGRFFAHDHAGQDAGRRAGLDERGLGENLYLAHRFSSYERYEQKGAVHYVFDWRSEEEIAQHAVAMWMESPTHRANLLSPVYGGQAIGVATGDGATVFITQSLAPR